MIRWADRSIASVATVIFVAFGMCSLMWWGPEITHTSGWQTPQDLWRTFVAGIRISRFDWAGLYTPPTTMVSFPGAAVILAPAAFVVRALRLTLGAPITGSTTPSAWWVLGPYEMLLSSTVFFGVDSLTRRLGATVPKRLVLAVATGIALSSPSIWWGHPEDCVAVALLLFALGAMSDSNQHRAAWLIGLSVAIQPLTLLALPVLVAAVSRNHRRPFVMKALCPAAVVVGLAIASNPKACYRAWANQPNWPAVDHPTPWVVLAPHLGSGTVAAGPARALALIAALGLAPVVARKLQTSNPHTRSLHRQTTTPDQQSRLLSVLLMGTATALGVRCLFESVMVAYYLWPTIAVALTAAVHNWKRLLSAAVLASATTLVPQLDWRSEWGWWLTALGLCGATLVAAGGRPRTAPDRAELTPRHFPMPTPDLAPATTD